MDSHIIDELIKHNKRSIVINNEKLYVVTFYYGIELQNSFRCHKDGKKTSGTYFIPKSIIKSMYIYSVTRNLPEHIKYERTRVSFLLPEWFCRDRIGFYA